MTTHLLRLTQLNILLSGLCCIPRYTIEQFHFPHLVLLLSMQHSYSPSSHGPVNTKSRGVVHICRCLSSKKRSIEFAQYLD